MRTVYPFGLNSRVDTGNQEVRNLNTYFNKLPRYSNRKRGRGRGKDREWNVENILETVLEKVNNARDELIRYCCKTFPQIPQKRLKILAQYLLDNNVPESVRDIAVRILTNCNESRTIPEVNHKKTGIS